LNEQEVPIQLAEISMIPENTVPVTDPEVAKKILGLMEALDDHDDVQNTYANFDIPDEVVSRLD
jgi:transcriptional/translational regulatory protein YebC/TACO1